MKSGPTPTTKAGAEAATPHEDTGEAGLAPVVLTHVALMQGGVTSIQGGIKAILFTGADLIPKIDSPAGIEDREESEADQSEEEKEPASQRYNSTMKLSIKVGRNQWFQDQGGGAINWIGEGLSPHHLDRNRSSSATSFHLVFSMASGGKQALGAATGAETTKGSQSQVATAEAGSSSNLGRRPGKELVRELGTSAERKALVVSIGKARGAARVRYLAVGIFLSTLTTTSKYLVDSMKKIWKTRGIIDTSPLEGRRFVLEFVEEGDFNHVIRGGPWRYKNDAVLIEALKEGEDPAAVVFSSVPIWVQFKEIPFYLLSKELARELGTR